MSNVVAGRIVQKGSGRGIPGLVVAAYDLDPHSDAVSQAQPQARDDPLPKGWPPDASDGFGDRIGSVLTEDDGHFTLPYDDDAFRGRNGQERRPDLVICVEAPDAALPNETSGRPWADRLLHFAVYPRGNAGRIEHYMIAIDTNMLAAHGIAISSTPPTPEEQRVLVKAALSKTAPVRDRVKTAKAASWRWVATKAMVDAQRFVAPDSDARAAHKAVVTEGMEKLGTMAAQQQTMRIRPEALDAIGLNARDIGTDGWVPVSVCGLLEQQGLSHSLEHVRGLLTYRHARREARLATTPMQDALEPAVPPEPAPVAAAGLAARVLGQVADLPAIEQGGGRSMLDELAKIKETINQLEISGGPANVTAFHDFHSLQLAFEDVWTAAFDERLRAKVLELYRQTVKVHEEHGLELPNLDEVTDANDLRRYLSDLRGECDLANLIEVPADVQETFPQLTTETWNRLDQRGRSILQGVVGRGGSQSRNNEFYEEVVRSHLTSPVAKIERLLLDIGDRLHEPYNFTYYAPYTINYGVLSTYRQEWVPDSYQVGRLVSTIPLAPGETRRLKVTKSLKKMRAEKAVEKALFDSSEERQFSSRAELDVITKLATATNFRLSAQGSFSIGIGSIGASSTFGANQSQESSRQQRSFAESTRKATQQVRHEREITVESSDSSELEIEATHELSNPNNELTVTYLLYELERRYHITTRLQRLTPVVLVALDIPAPHEITEGWILENDWIVRRVLLDDSFIEALDHIRDGLAADELDVEIKKANWERQQSLVSKLEGQLTSVHERRDQRRATLVDLVQGIDLAQLKDKPEEQRIAEAIFSGGISELFGGGQDHSDERLKAMRKGVEQALEFIAEETARLEERLGASRRELTIASEAYSAAIVEKERKDTRVNQLRLHVRQNIFHYMHAIWESTHPDQRFFELNDREVPFFGDENSCRLRRATAAEEPETVPFLTVDGDAYVVECVPPAAAEATLPTRRLGTIAELDRPLGFKGNYVIFPLKECSHITHFMSHSAIDDYFGIRDPFTDDGYTEEDLLEYARDLVQHPDPEAPLSAADVATLREFVVSKLSRPQSLRETVMIPTGELFMEALKGEQALLEDFKLAHRGLDVLKVQEEIRGARLENLRRASRLVAETPLLDDFDVDNRVTIEGSDVGVDLDV